MSRDGIIYYLSKHLNIRMSELLFELAKLDGEESDAEVDTKEELKLIAPKENYAASKEAHSEETDNEVESIESPNEKPEVFRKQTCCECGIVFNSKNELFSHFSTNPIKSRKSNFGK